MGRSEYKKTRAFEKEQSVGLFFFQVLMAYIKGTFIYYFKRQVRQKMNIQENRFRAALIVFCLICLTGVLAIRFTFAGNPEAPDATVTYTKNNMQWDIPTDGSGTADLGIFGEAGEDEQYPLVHPFSGDTYYLRLKNGVRGQIGYSMYIYCENEHDIPLEFKVTKTEDMKNISKINYPASLKDKEVLAAVSGAVDGYNLKDFEIDWSWKTKSDETDTEIGDAAVDEDLLYTINVLMIIEDNNIYRANGGKGIDTQKARLLHRHYMLGYPEGDFRPEGNITRAEVSAMFARILANYNEDVMTETKTDFPDVPEDKWHAKYIAFLRDKDIISGYPDGSFAPDKKITRAEFAAVCVRYVENQTGNLKPEDISFTDFSKNHWAKEYIRKAYAEGYIVGFPDGTLKADDEITRAEAVTIVNRILGRSADVNYVDTHLHLLNHFWDLEDNTYWAYYEIYEAANTHDLLMLEESEEWFK